ncbi:MAG: signal peptidase I [Sinobacteraceae bacterium]|nr:signal peptidase I [Nevskiaceae bacterium]
MSFVVVFNYVLTLLTAITGVVWLLDKLWLARRRRERTGAEAKPGAVVDFCVGLFPVILLVFVVRSFIVEPFRIPSGSMIPTLHVGDFILVNKFDYGLRCPVGRCKFLDIGEPKRGDVVVFRWPRDPSVDFIKRVIGLPGDHIRYVNKVLTVNGDTASLTPAGGGGEEGAQRFHEVFSGVRHDILIVPDRVGDPYSCPFVHPNPDDFEYTVPPGQYFMMGDNRDGSNDSRCWGTVPEADLKGKAILIWMSWNGAPVFSRIGTLIH